jgi:hypothetical protein
VGSLRRRVGPERVGHCREGRSVKRDGGGLLGVSGVIWNGFVGELGGLWMPS